MSENLLQNGNFEADWSEQKSHEAHVIVPALGGGNTFSIRDIGNIFTPPGWMTWFYHEPGTWDQPEVQDAWDYVDQRRVRSGRKAAKFFTFYRKHWGGFYQRVKVTPGQRLEFSCFIHAWSNHDGEGYPHPHDGKWSEGVGYEVASIWEQVYEPDNGDPQHDAIRNFTFRVGIDPTGGIDPLADSVVWSHRYSNYNGYTDPISVEATAQAEYVTVFIESKTAWAFCHNDFYCDDAVLEVISDPTPPDPEPPARQYERVAHLLPQDASLLEIAEVVEAAAPKKQTITWSADDAFIDHDNLTKRTVHVWGEWDGLVEFAETYYPPLPEIIYHEFTAIEPPEPEPEPEEPQYPDPGQLISLHSQAGWRGDLEFIRAVRPSTYKLVLGMERAHEVKAASPDTLVIYRPYAAHQSQYLYHAAGPRAGAQEYINTFSDSLSKMQGAIDYVESLNEEVPTHNLDKLRLLALFEAAFCELMAEQFPWVKVVVLTAAVGNPDHDEVHFMLPAVRACVAAGGALGYHAYWNVHDQQSQLTQDWLHHAGRALESWDPVFRDAGLYPRYIFGECGAVEDMKPNDGWQTAYNLEKYLADILLFREKMQAWNALHGNRIIGATLFTLGGGSVWREFEHGPYLGALAEALRA